MQNVCESCGQVKPLIDVAHPQKGNKKILHYCIDCKRARDIEVEVQKRLVILMATDPNGANDPIVVGHIREEVDKALPIEAEIV